MPTSATVRFNRPIGFAYRSKCRLPTALPLGGAFRTNWCMSRYVGHEGGMGWTARILLAIIVLVILGAVGLGIYAGTLKPPHQTYTVVIPNARFPS
jgi:hypothetical protein